MPRDKWGRIIPEKVKKDAGKVTKKKMLSVIVKACKTQDDDVFWILRTFGMHDDPNNIYSSGIFDEDIEEIYSWEDTAKDWAQYESVSTIEKAYQIAKKILSKSIYK